jgi:hypothetical protein
MPHGYFFLSEQQHQHKPEFPKDPDAIIEMIAAELGQGPGEVEIFKMNERPLSSKPLDVELRIDADAQEGDMNFTEAARNLYWFLKGHPEVPEEATVGVWLRWNSGGWCFIHAENAED